MLKEMKSVTSRDERAQITSGEKSIKSVTSALKWIKGRLKWIQSLFCMVFCFGLTVTSHHILFKNVFKVDFVLTVNYFNDKWVKKNYSRKR